MSVAADDLTFSHAFTEAVETQDAKSSQAAAPDQAVPADAGASAGAADANAGSAGAASPGPAGGAGDQAQPQAAGQTTTQATDQTGGQANAQPAAGQPSSQPATLTPELIEAAKAYGIDATDQAAFVQAALQRLQETQTYVDYARQLLPYQDQIREYFEQQQKPAQQQQPADEWTPEKHFQSVWGDVRWNPQYDAAIQAGHVTRNEHGAWVASPGYEVLVAPLLPELNRAQQHQSQKWAELGKQNPYEAMYKALVEPLQRQWRQDMQQLYSGRRQEETKASLVEQFEQENAHWIYQVDPVTNRRLVTADGKRLYDEIAELREDGVTDPAKIIKRLTRSFEDKIKGKQGSGGAAGQATPPAVPAPAQQNQAPSQPQAPAQPNQTQQPFLDNALRRAVHGGSSNGGGGQDPNSVILNEGDLHNLFVAAVPKR